MELVLLAIAAAVLVAWYSSRGESPATKRLDTGDKTVRFFVHRAPFIEAFDAMVKGEWVFEPAHEPLLERTRLRAKVILAGPDRDDVLPVSTALLTELAKTITEDDLRAEFMRAANEELRALPFAWSERAPGFFACATSDGRAAARLLRTEVFQTLPFAEHAVVMVPNEDTLLVADVRNDDALRAMLAEAEASFTGPSWLTLWPMRWSGTEWKVWAPDEGEDLTRAFMGASARGTLAEFRDATSQAPFPVARSVVVDSCITSTWLSGTSVIVPNWNWYDIQTLRLVDAGRDEPVFVEGTWLPYLLLSIGRDFFLNYTVLDEALFPPPAVIELLEQLDDVEDFTQVKLSATELGPLVKKGALIIPGDDASDAQVWLTDGRWTLVASKHQAGLVDELPGELRPWAKRLCQHRAKNAARGLAMAKRLAAVPVINALIDSGRLGDALELCDTTYSAHGLDESGLEAALALAQQLDQPDAIRTWGRRGIAQAPLNQTFRVALLKVQFEHASRPGSARPTASDTVDESGPRATLMAVLRPPGERAKQAELMKARAQQEASGAQVLIQDPLRWPLGHGLELESVYDLGNTMQPLSMMDAAGSLAADFKRIALANLRAATGHWPEKKQPFWSGDWPDNLAASRVLLPWSALDWLADRPPQDLIALTPHTDAFLVAPADDPQGLLGMMSEAERLVSGVNPERAWRVLLTANPWRLVNDVWVPYAFETNHPLAARAAALEAAITRAREAVAFSA